MSFRARLGVWLLKPLLVEELDLARKGQARTDPEARPDLERYWMGRFTAVRRIMHGEESSVG